MEEGLELKASAHLQGEVSADIPFTRSIRQGGIESAREWNLVVRRILDSCYDRWESQQYGIKLPLLGAVTHVVWADNIYFIGRSRDAVIAMGQDFTDILVACGMQWKKSSLQLLATLPHEEINCASLGLWQHGHFQPIELVVDMEALGTIISTSGSPLKPVRHRLAKATAAFWRISSALLCPDLSLHQRFQEFAK